MTDVVLDRVTKSYGAHKAVRQVDLHIAPGEFLTLLGPSGCGKTTCLRMVAGFVAPTSGRILTGGQDITAMPPHRRDLGMVFQSYALFPHLTVAENVAFGLRVRRLSRAERDRRTAEALRLVRLSALAERYPSQLSGGQRQRVALARAVVIEPKVLLLDEPLGALDLKLREELQTEIKRVQAELNMTTLFVTHDQGEALSMSDRIAVMRNGAVVQTATPIALYENPNCRFVADFLGKTNLIEVVVEAQDAGGYAVRTSGAAPARYRALRRGAPGSLAAFAPGGACLLAIRPEHLHLGAGWPNRMPGVVRGLSYLGNIWQVDIDAAGGTRLLSFLHPGDAVPKPGDRVDVGWAPEHCFLLDAAETPPGLEG